MKKYIIVLVILGVFISSCFPVGAKEINLADVKRIVISGSIVTIEKKDGDIFLIGSGRSKDNAHDIKEKEYNEIYDFLEGHADTKMEEKRFSEAADIYKAIGDMKKYQEARLSEAKQNEEKKYWEAAAYDYNAAGRPEKAIDMWKKENGGHTYFSTFGTGHEEEDIKKRIQELEDGKY